MPVRKIVFTTGNYYHIYNRGVNRSQIFFGVADFKRFYNLLSYYRNQTPPLRYSDYADLNAQLMFEFIHKLNECAKLVEVHAYCLMDNHYHLLLKQTQDGGIVKFMALITNGYTKYLNTRKQRSGPVFTGPFKAVYVNSEEQLIHLSRYIHLNPVEAQMVSVNNLGQYKWSSYNSYVANSTDILVTKYAIESVLKTQKEHLNFVKRQVQLAELAIHDAHYKMEN